VDREFVLSYSIQDEVKSFFFAQNLAQLGTGLSNDQQTTLAADDTNAANEQFHTINGASLNLNLTLPWPRLSRWPPTTPTRSASSSTPSTVRRRRRPRCGVRAGAGWALGACSRLGLGRLTLGAGAAHAWGLGGTAQQPAARRARRRAATNAQQPSSVRTRRLRVSNYPKPCGCGAGMLYCNLPHLHAKVGDRVRLHIFALGTENGIHAPAIIASTMNLEARLPRSPWALDSGLCALLTSLFLGMQH
jgi:hypothetical protein